MKVITLDNELKVYHFNNEAKGEFVGYNVFVVENGKECLLIDTAFRRHFNQLQEDLTKQGKTITTLITTHFHKDHIGGILKLQDATKYASSDCEVTIKKVFKNQDYTKYLPDIYVEGMQTIDFGKHKITMMQNPGHSVDGLLVIIDNKYVFVGDDMIYSRDFEELLPFASEGDNDAHIESLNRILELTYERIVVPTHGKILEDKDYIKKDIENRIQFLEAQKLNRDITNEEFYDQTGIYFLGHLWYKNNV